MRWFKKNSGRSTGPDPEAAKRPVQDQDGPAGKETVQNKQAPDEPESVASEILRRVGSAGLPENIFRAARTECERLLKMDPATPEFAQAYNYVEFILSLPWNSTTKDDLDLARARDVLDARHQGLTNVKERILEFLAVGRLQSLRKHSLIIADDEPIARENLSIVFEHDGFAVRTVANGLEAVRAMEEDPADIVITDLKMERMDGLELLQEIRTHWPHTGVIMLTGYATVKTAVEAMKKGADQYLGKPVNLTRLRQYVDDLLGMNQRIQGLRGPVLCFTGPPGTGKTSIGRAIAEAMGRKFICMSLAGLRDEAELRGHRRSYVGAMAGRLLQNIQKSGVKNPVVMLDEMDKIIQSFQGDASSVLLEILDHQQNSAFVDHYLGLPFDLSGVLFIATANITERIPGPLLDRMETIEFSSYTVSEKLNIAENHLVPGQMMRHGLTPNQVTIQPEALEAMIKDYTREAGLRGLEKQVAALCRKLARRVLESENPDKTLDIGKQEMESILGPAPFSTALAGHEPKVGTATGLVWSENGGDILFVEVAKMHGSKNLILTGSLGDVLRESARTALSYLRSNAKGLGIEPDFFETSDIHVHIPAGSVTKEGPSAGVTIAVAILSQLTGRAVRQDTAFSGEISLHGDVLPVGGVREKVMAASRSGIKKVVLPEQCQAAVKAIEPEVVRDMEIKLVSRLDQVWEQAFA